MSDLDTCPDYTDVRKGRDNGNRRRSQRSPGHPANRQSLRARRTHTMTSAPFAMYLAGTSRRHETDAPVCVELDQRNGNAPADVRLLHITPVERAVLQLLADGNATREIAVRLGVLESAVDDCL